MCRFAKLSVDEQRIARTASIIGTSFSADVLNNILPKQLRAYLPTILDSLVRSHWLNSSSEQRAEGIRVEYSFSHPLLHRTLYDLTPSSVKCKIHLLIAKVSTIANFNISSCFQNFAHYYRLVDCIFYFLPSISMSNLHSCCIIIFDLRLPLLNLLPIHL